LQASTVRVLVVEDYEPFRRFVRSMLQKKPELQVIHEASDGLEAIRKAEELQPDLILLDIGLPEINGIEAARRIRAVGLRSRILFLSEHCSPDIADEALGTGAQGYVVKSCAAGELLIAMEAVVQGKQFLSSGLGSVGAPGSVRAPIIYSIDTNRRLIHTKCVGMVTLDDVINHFRELGRDPACPDRLDVFLDLRQTTSLPESGQLRAVSNEVAGIRERVGFGFCAIVAAGDALFGMMRVFEALAQQYFRAIRVFRVAAEAEKWLTLQRLSVQ
jgi:CheY-like chemotaxis protein